MNRDLEIALTAFLVAIAIFAWLSLGAVMLGSVADAFVKTRIGQWFDRVFGRIVLLIEKAWSGTANAGRRRG